MHCQAIPLITFFTLNTVDNTLFLLKEDHPVFLRTAGERGRKKTKADFWQSNKKPKQTACWEKQKRDQNS